MTACLLTGRRSFIDAHGPGKRGLGGRLAEPCLDDGMEPVPVSAARTTLTQIMTSLDVNLLGTVHGGVVMRMVDSVAGAAAGRHSRGPAVTVSMDEMVFLQPVRVGDLIHAHAQVNWAGRTSMEVGVRVTSERWNEIDPPVHVASAYLVFVAVDDEGRPRPVPPVVAESGEDRRRLAEAQIRRQHRLARRDEIARLRAGKK